MSEPKTGPRAKHFRLNWLTVVAAALAAVTVLFLVSAHLSQNLLYFVRVAVVAGGAICVALVAFLVCIARRQVAGGLVAGAALLISALAGHAALDALETARLSSQVGRCQWNLSYLWEIQWYVEDTGRVLQTLNELVEADYIEPGVLVCPTAEHCAELVAAGAYTYILAPLDVRFYDEYFQEDRDSRAGAFLLAYCTVEHYEGTPQRQYVTLAGWGRQLPLAELKTWEVVQREAIGWLDDNFPMHDLEQIAKDQGNRRREMASVILGYRQARLGETLTEDVRR